MRHGMHHGMQKLRVGANTSCTTDCQEVIASCRACRFCLRVRGWYAESTEMLGQSKIPGVMVLDEKSSRGKHLPITPSDHYGVLVQLRIRGADSLPAMPAAGRNQHFQKQG